MDLFVAFIGGLIMTLLVATGITAVITPLLLWLYRRATLQEMEESAGVTKSFPKPNIGRGSAPVNHLPLIIREQQTEISQAATAATSATQAAYHRLSRSLWMTALVYAAGGIAYALIVTIPWIITSGDGFIFKSFLWLFASHAWPLVLIISLVAATNLRETFYIAAGYFGIVVVIALYIMVQSSTPYSLIWQFVYVWFHVNGISTILALAFLHSRIRAVGPLVLVFMIMGTAGALLVFKGAVNNEALVHVLLTISAAFGSGATAVTVLLFAAGFVILGILGWWLLGWLGRRYQAKHFSDQSLTIDALWLLFGIVQPLGFALTDSIAWIFTGLIAFVVYKLVTLTGFALLRKSVDTDANASTLLLLRVFSLGRRSERFFNSVSKMWRHLGPINLIAGPDLVTAEVEPHEFLEFVGGRLSRRFVRGEEDLEQRLAVLDRQPDPDGSYRVNEFFCHADTWKVTMRQLTKESNVVLMDLRSFSPANQGCLYEVEQLLKIIDLRKVVFLIDKTTDTPFLEEQFHHIWQGVGHESPNFGAESPTVRLFNLEHQSAPLTKSLIFTLLNNPIEA